jgi:pimeloyl-ACP methyl ester carboxylesterase
MTEPAKPGVKRHYVTVGSRQIHYRRAGTGPPLIALHRFPRTSQDLEPFIESAMARFTVIAPDLAGYGKTDPFSTAPGSPATFAEDLVAFIHALGIKHVLVYGEQAGAAIACTLAGRSPELVAAVAVWDLDLPGALNLPPSAKNPLPKFEPSWDGSHLTWLWAMLREQAAFHPYHSPALNTRVDADMPSAAELQRRVVQFLSAAGLGRNYDVGYGAVRAFDAIGILSQVTVPTLVVARQRHDGLDPWRAAASRAQTVQAAVATEYETGVNQALAFLSMRDVHADVKAPPPATPVRGKLCRDYVDVDGGQLHFQSNADVESTPLLIQHDAASSVGTVEPITQSYIGKRSVMAFDMPGSGESDRIIAEVGVTVADYANVLDQALLNLGIEKIDFYGMWGGGFVGLDIALNHPGRIRRLVMSNVFQHTGSERDEMSENYVPDVSPVWHGGHLMQCWHQMRDQGIYYPWYKRTREGVIWREPFVATDMVHERVCSLLKAGNMYRTAYRAHFNYPTYDRLAQSPVPTLLATSEWDPNNPHTLAAASAAPNCEFQYLDADFTRWGLGFLQFLGASPG